MSNAQKIPLGRSLNRIAQLRAAEAIQITGRALPCTVAAVNGAIVTVNFEINSPYTLPQVAVPVAGSQYVREPLQVGCKGYVAVASARLGQMSGLSQTAADLTEPGNLGALVFQPLGNADWPEVNPDMLVLNGPEGVLLYAADGSGAQIEVTGDVATLTLGTNTVEVTATAVTLSSGANTIVVDASGVTITGVLTINGVPYLLHTHSGVTTGPGNSGPVTV